MGISFHDTGKLGDVLQRLRARFLAHLTPDDLDQQVTLSIQKTGEESAEDSKSLKEQLLEVISDE